MFDSLGFVNRNIFFEKKGRFPSPPPKQGGGWAGFIPERDEDPSLARRASGEEVNGSNLRKN